jgi:hypothetical protein
MVPVCAGDRMKKGTVSSACQKFLDGSEPASMQWQLEMEFAKFEAKY